MTSIHITLETATCCTCGLAFGLPDHFKASLLASGQTFFCPSGHKLTYGISDADMLRGQLLEKQRELTAAKCETLREKQEREKAQADLAKHRRRTKNGVCPCCRRTFVRLAKHITHKHPAYAQTMKGKLP